MIPGYVKYLLKMYGLGIVVFSLFRLGETLLNLNLLANIPEGERFFMVVQAMYLGLRFDTTMSMYFLLLPLLVLFVNHLAFRDNKIVARVVHALISVLFVFAFFICSADIPYFDHFNYRITSASLMWAESTDVVVNMVAQDIMYWGMFIPFILVSYGYLRIGKHIRLTSFHAQDNPAITWWKKPIVFLVAATVCFFALRGKVNMNTKPLNPVDAYFSDYSSVNQLSLNPMYTFLKSFLDQQKQSNKGVQFMDEELAIRLVKNYLGRPGSEVSPIAKPFIPDTTYPNKPNLVLVLMEGLSAARMGTYGSPHDCTPYLDSLITRSYFFNQAYSAGIHTHNGIYSALTSFPALLDRHAMTQIPILRYNNLITALEAHDYSSIYFTNHHLDFDNVGGFLTENGVDKIISTRNYDPERIMGIWGVADDYMFDYAMPVLNDLGAGDKPFVSMFMTTSNHRPFRFPENYPRRFPNDDILEGNAYADWSIQQFMSKAQQQKWFENTIFVFMADHGWAIDPKYDVSLNYVHVPMFFYSPKYFSTPQVDTNLAGQIDLFPSIMHAMQLPFTNTTMGIDLFAEKRPYIYFNADNKIGVIDHENLYIYRKDGPESFYELPRTEDILKSNSEKANAMRDYAFAHLQATYALISKNKVGAN